MNKAEVMSMIKNLVSCASSYSTACDNLNFEATEIYYDYDCEISAYKIDNGIQVSVFNKDWEESFEHFFAEAEKDNI